MSKTRQPQQELDDEDELVHQGADYRNPAEAGTEGEDGRGPSAPCISSTTFFNLKAGGAMDVSDVLRLKVVDDENAKLKLLLAEAMLDAALSKGLGGKKWQE